MIENQARDHYTAPGEEELLDGIDDEDGGMGETTGLLGSHHDIRLLENGMPEYNEYEEEEEEQQAYAELSNNMRISRYVGGSRHIPTTPHSIRPSLVGALEVCFNGSYCIDNNLPTVISFDLFCTPSGKHRIFKEVGSTSAGTSTTRLHPEDIQHQVL